MATICSGRPPQAPQPSFDLLRLAVLGFDRRGVWGLLLLELLGDAGHVLVEARDCTRTAVCPAVDKITTRIGGGGSG